MDYSNKTPSNPQSDNEEFEDPATSLTPTNVYVTTNIATGYTKIEDDSSLKIVDSQTIENYGKNNELQRKFAFSHIFDNQAKCEAFFQTVCRPLADSAFNKGLQHSIMLYEPASSHHFVNFLGLADPHKDLEDCLLYHALKYVLELSISPQKQRTAVQVSLVGVEGENLIDLFNSGEPLEAPLGYTLERVEEIRNFLVYANRLLSLNIDIEHLCISLYYQNKNTIESSAEVKDACLNLLIVKGDETIQLTDFLTFEKESIREESRSNYAEKLLLHFLSVNYDPLELPYQNTCLAYFLKKYIPFSDQKDLVFYVNMQRKSIEEVANDLLYLELCQEIAEAPREEVQHRQVNVSENELIEEDSRTLHNLSIPHEKIKTEYEDLQIKRNKLERGLGKFESVTTANTNPLNQIQKFSLHSQYERFLHEMNHKLADLLQASVGLISELKGTNNEGSMVSQELLRVEEKEKEKQVYNTRKTQIGSLRKCEEEGNEENLSLLKVNREQHSVIVKDVNHKYPSIMLNPTYNHEGEYPDSYRDHSHREKTLLGNIDLLQNELKANLDFIGNNFEILKQQIKRHPRPSIQRKSREILVEMIERKQRFAENILNSNNQDPRDNHRRSASLMREHDFGFLEKRHFSCGLENALGRKELLGSFNEPTQQGGVVKQEDAKRMEEDQRKIMETQEDWTDRSPFPTTQRNENKSLLAIPIKNFQNNPQKEELLGVMWRKMVAFSYKEASSKMNELFLNLTKDNESKTTFCGQSKTKQRIKPSDNSNTNSKTQAQIQTTFEEFRTTFERFDTEFDYGSHTARHKIIQEKDQLINEEKEEVKQDTVIEEKKKTHHRNLTNNSIESIKPVRNKYSFSIPYSPNVSPNKKKKKAFQFEEEKVNARKLERKSDPPIMQRDNNDFATTQDNMGKLKEFEMKNKNQMIKLSPEVSVIKTAR